MSRESRSAFHWAVLVTGLSLGLTVVAYWHAQREIDRLCRAQFSARVNAAINEAEKRLAYYQQVLQGTQALSLANPKLDDSEFHAYLAALNLREPYPGIEDIGIAVTVPRHMLRTHLVQMRKHYPAYKIWPVGERETYTAIVQVAWREKEKIIGLDMHENPARRAAMERARDEAKPARTEKLKLRIDKSGDDGTGFLLYLPIYKYGQTVATTAERRAYTMGWVYAAFRMRDLVANLDMLQSDDMAIEIYDGDAIGEHSLMFAVGQGKKDGLIPDQLREVRSIPFADRNLTFVFHPTAAFISHQDSGKPLLIAVLGAALSLSLGGLVGMLVQGRAKAQSAALRAERNFLESESRFWLMANAAPVMIWISDRNRRHLWVNRRLSAFTGYDKTDDWGAVWHSFVHPEDLAQLERIHVKAFADKHPFDTVFRLMRHDGEFRWISDHGVPRFDGNGDFVGYVGICLDITEARRAEEELKLAALVFHTSSDAMTVAEYQRDDKLVTIAVNPAHRRLTGYEPEEVIGRDVTESMSECHDKAYYDAMEQQLMNTGQWEGEYWARLRDGQHVIVWLNLCMVWDLSGNKYRLVTLARDISRQKESENMIRELSTSLLTAREEEARRIAREIHDDLGQKMYWVRMNLQMLMQFLPRQPDLLEESYRRMILSLDGCMTRVRQIATDLRPPELDIGFEPAIEALLDNLADSTGLSCDLSYELDEAFRLTDEAATCLYRIVQEALTNVARHAEARGVNVRIGLDEDLVRLRISDDGKGFDSAVGYRPHAHGLTGMRERVAMLGGQIDVLGAPGTGVTVDVSVPVSRVTFMGCMGQA